MIKLLVFHFLFSAGIFLILQVPLTDQEQADAPSVTGSFPGLLSPTEPGPVSSNNYDFLVGLISPIRLDKT